MARRVSIFRLACWAGLVLVASASAQPVPVQPAAPVPAPLETEIIVEGALLLEAVPDFVNKARPAAHGKQLARWHGGPLCPAARGFFPVQEKAILARMDAVAREAGLPAAAPGCKPNVILLLTDQPDLLIDTTLDRHGALFAPQPLLKALYATKADISAAQQRHAIARRMETGRDEP